MEKQLQENKSFLDLIKVDTICIPVIQRDYAQGREDTNTKEIRSNFLEEIVNTLNTDDMLLLDFIYGSSKDGKFIPLDGQQRLTTLFLLHWYLASDENLNILRDDKTSKFTYETRISSKDFCNQIVQKPLTSIDRTGFKMLSEAITNQPWFMWSWRKDPTIKGMLVMLDAIDGKLIKEIDKTKLWEKLADHKIVFHLLPLEQFGLDDELFVKMNARGKLLSPFDKFKSTLEEQILKNCPDIQGEWRSKVDSCWMDLFWHSSAYPALDGKNIDVSNKDSQKEITKILENVEIDYLNFFKQMMVFYLFLNDESILKISENKEEQKEVDEVSLKSFREQVVSSNILEVVPSLCKHKFFRESFFTFVLSSMDALLYEDHQMIVKEGGTLIDPLYLWVGSPFKNFIKEEITYLDRVMFFAQLQFFKYHKADDVKDNSELNNWMRIIRNLAYNTTYNKPEEFGNILKSLETLASNVYAEPQSTVLTYFKEEGNVERFYGEQVKEEREKARKICEDDSWEAKIIEAENYAFFKGAIRFLFTTETGKYDWNLFDKRFEKAKEYFDEKGVKEEYKKDARLICALISKFTKWEQCWCPIGHGSETLGYILRNKDLQPAIATLLDMATIPETILNYTSTIAQFDAGYKGKEKLAHEDMCNNHLVNEAIDNMGEGIRLNLKYNQYALYKPNANADWKKYVIGNNRNQALADLYDKGIITCAQRIKNAPYFWGWEVDFTYKSEKYRCGRDDKLHKKNNNDEWEEVCINLNNIVDCLNE
jgi:hypothetical protein